MKKTLALALFVFAIAALSHSGEMHLGTNPRVAAYFEKAKANRPTLVAFLHKMPKGGDLHNHPAGAVYAETLVQMAIDKGMYFDRETLFFTAEKPSGPHYTPEELAESYWKHGEIIEALSLRNLHLAGESGHDRFFRSFDRFFPALVEELPIIKEVIRRALNQEVAYIELMALPSTAPEWREQLEAARREVVAEFAAKGIHRDLQVRIIYPLLRIADPEDFRRQTADAFAAAAAMPDLVVGITLLAPEDDPTSQRHFREHMQIIEDALRIACRKHSDDPANNPVPPRLMLHSGELTLEYATYESMTDRIETTLKTGHASRIGHGASIMWEDNVYDVLRYMRDNRIALEFCPSSSEQILASGREKHPFPLYWSADVPVVIATDDEGVARSTLTLEYAKAIDWFDLAYPEIKWLAFNSLEYSFLPGESCFVGGDFNRLRADADALALQSDKARMQLDMLNRFAAFEKKMVKVMDTFGW